MGIDRSISGWGRVGAGVILTIIAAAILPGRAIAQENPAGGAASQPTVSRTDTTAPAASRSDITPPVSKPNPLLRHAPRHLDPVHPLKVWAGGDSLCCNPAASLENTLKRTGVATCRIDFMNSTGLTRTAVRDWRARFRTVVARWDPDVVVVIMGASDPQPMQIGWRTVRFNTRRWLREYARRLGEAMDTLRDGGRLVLWVGMPVMRGGHAVGNSENMSVLNRLFIQEASTRPGVVYVDSWKLFSTPSGAYADALPGTPRLRASDGIHFSYAGGERLAKVLYKLIDERWNLGEYLPQRPSNGGTLAGAGTGNTGAGTPKPPRRMVVEASLLKATPTPDPRLIAPYRRALVIDQYRVKKVIEGSGKLETISVAHWGILNARAFPSSREVGQTYRLVLEDFDDHPELNGEARFPDEDDYAGGLYVEVKG